VFVVKVSQTNVFADTANVLLALEVKPIVVVGIVKTTPRRGIEETDEITDDSDVST